MTEKLHDIIFYNIDKAIRTYRMYAQKKLKENGFKITIDQWLIIKAIQENPHITQQDLAKIVFKDNASVTRIIEILVKMNYLIKEIDTRDRRKSNLTVTPQGELIIQKVHNLVLENRKKALSEVSEIDIEIMNSSLKKIIHNCQ